MKRRRNPGDFQHVAKFVRHNGRTDRHGNPTTGIPSDWNQVVVESWPCELLTTTGGETVRGRQVTAQTTHVLFGEFHGCDGVNHTDRAMVNGEDRFEVLVVTDPDGTQMERRVELKLER